MPTAKKPTPTSPTFSAEQIAAAQAAAQGSALSPAGQADTAIDWRTGLVTLGGGVASTVAALRRARGPNKQPTKEQVAIRLDRDVLGAFRAGGPGWQTRVNLALKEWLAAQPAKPKTKAQRAG